MFGARDASMRVAVLQRPDSPDPDSLFYEPFDLDPPDIFYVVMHSDKYAVSGVPTPLIFSPCPRHYILSPRSSGGFYFEPIWVRPPNRGARRLIKR